MSTTLLDLYHEHVASVFEKQMRLADFLDEQGDGGNWSYNVPSGSLTFGEALQFSAPLLGTFAEGNATWLWSWANRHLNLPVENLTLAEAVRRLGDGSSAGLFWADGEVSCAELLPDELCEVATHVFGLAFTGALGYSAYYLMPYEGGCGVALIRDGRLRVTEPTPLVRVASVFTQAISTYPIPNQRAALTAYLRRRGLTVEAAGPSLVALSAGEAVLTAHFDESDRLTKLECTVGPETEAG